MEPASGAGRRARERKTRSTARHVAWLVSNFQAAQSHHTATGSGRELATCSGCAALELRLRDLECQLRVIGAQAGMAEHLGKDGHDEDVGENQVQSNTFMTDSNQRAHYSTTHEPVAVKEDCASVTLNKDKEQSEGEAGHQSSGGGSGDQVVPEDVKIEKIEQIEQEGNAEDGQELADSLGALPVPWAWPDRPPSISSLAPPLQALDEYGVTDIACDNTVEGEGEIAVERVDYDEQEGRGHSDADIPIGELGAVKAEIDAILANDQPTPGQHRRLQALLRTEEDLQKLG